MEGVMRKVMLAVCALAGRGGFYDARDVGRGSHQGGEGAAPLMKDIVGKNTKLGADMLKGKVAYDGAQLAKAMTAIATFPTNM